MNALAPRLSRFTRHSYFPLVLLLIADLITGLFTFQDYGLSWDEPLFYQYAQAVPYAYSIPARLSGNFDIEKAYGPSAEDHKIYGPIYLLLAKPAVDVLDWLHPAQRADLWHLVNFITFLIGLVFFYALCLRWMKPWVAFGATALFSTQPVIFGHAWINPKDMPFTVFFIASIYLGFKMVDALSVRSPGGSITSLEASEPDPRRWSTARLVFQGLAIAFCLVTLVCLVFYGQLQAWLGDLIRSAYLAAPESFLGRVFSYLAANAQTVPAEAYIAKGLVLLGRARTILVVLSGLFLIPAAVLTFWKPQFQHFLDIFSSTLSPLPVKPSWWWSRLRARGVLLVTLLAGILLGLLVSIRIIGPLAGLLVMLYFFFKPGRHSFAGVIVYLLAAAIALYASWPYLWASPLARFFEVLQHMSHNPKILPVLFRGVVYPSDRLPVAYLPVMLGITLTWPAWPLLIAGVGIAWARVRSIKADWRSLVPIFLWFGLPFAYVLVVRPPIYDGYRHFLFILPPVFILGGVALQALWERLGGHWAYAVSLAVLVVPGVLGLVRMHPYQYSYYNLLVGGVGGAYRQYETDFWLTCYKELMAEVDEQVPAGSTVFVHRQPSIAQVYASPGLVIEPFDPEADRTFPGSLLLLSTRANVDLPLHPEAPVLFSVGREGAVFCLVKGIP